MSTPIETPSVIDTRPINHRVLALDGGGAKGVYSLGFLSRLEKDIGCPLREKFDLIYGTSTGSIIAALLSLGMCVDEIYALYLQHIPKILTPHFSRQRSDALADLADSLFGKRLWSDLSVPTGIVATNWTTKQPLIFKNFDTMAHVGKNAFIPGFGASVSKAVQASCSAVPYFRPVNLTIANRGGESVDAYDGGYCANNPALFALVDLEPLKLNPEHTVLFSVGVGHYPEPQEFTPTRWIAKHVLKRLASVQILAGVLEVNSNTNGILQKLAMKNVRYIRSDETFNLPELGADLMETKCDKLRRLYACGTRNYEAQEKAIQCYL
jgi:predicted acylesterase/phospholipase RssA